MLLAALFAGCGLGPRGGASLSGTPTVPVELLPPDGVVDGLRRSGPPEVFSGAELYNQIDGGAELFLELGFDHLVVQDYTVKGVELEVELYVMRDDVAAAGVYLQGCGRETRAPGLPDRNTVNPYQAQLLHGRYYVVVNDAAGGGEDKAMLVELGRAVAERLPTAGPLRVLDTLPARHRVPGSERIARGPLGLQRIVTLGEGDVLQLSGKNTAVAADYEVPDAGRITRLVVNYPDPASAAAALQHVENTLDSYHEVVSRAPSKLVIRDLGGRFGELTVEGSTLVARLNLPTSPAGF